MQGQYLIALKDFSNGVLDNPIGAHLASTLKGFVVRSPIPNLTHGASFDYNSCISSLNEECKGTLGI
jgi:hypothetical protein